MSVHNQFNNSIMQTKTVIKGSLAFLALTVFAGCQTVPQAPEDIQPTITPTGQSMSTVEITNSVYTPDAMTQEEMVKPYDGSLPEADRQAFMKADEAKNPALCETISVESYKKLCQQQASDKNSPPMMTAAPTQENCKEVTTDPQTGVKNCLNYEE